MSVKSPIPSPETEVGKTKTDSDSPSEAKTEQKQAPEMPVDFGDIKESVDRNSVPSPKETIANIKKTVSDKIKLMSGGEDEEPPQSLDTKHSFGKIAEDALVTPISVSGNILRGTVVNAAERTYEVAKPAAGIVKSTLGTAKDLVFNIKKPRKYLWEGPYKIVSNSLNLVKSVIRLPFNALDSVAKNVIDKPLTKVTYFIEKIPVVKELVFPFTRLIRGVGKGASKITGKLNSFLDKLFGGSSKTDKSSK